MNTDQILISMARYIHSFYDVEIDTSRPDLHVKLKHFMGEKNDETLNHYWSEYLSSLNPDMDKVTLQDSANVIASGYKAATYYRGVKIEA